MRCWPLLPSSRRGRWRRRWRSRVAPL